MTSGADTADLTLRALRVFLAVEETGSIALAARRLGGSPSGVSQHITALEAALGTRLFDRKVRPVTLTPAGQVMRLHARRILSAVSQAQTELAELSVASLPRLGLALIDDLDASLTPVLVQTLQARLPLCHVHVFSGRSDHVLDRLLAREADIAVTALTPADPGGFRVLPILTERFVLVAARGVLPPGVTVPQLEALPFVQYSETLPIGRKVALHLRRVGVTTAPRHALEATRSVIAMVVQSGGWTLTTPLNLLDADRLADQISVIAPPFAGETRHVNLIARVAELGHLPDDLARDCRRIVRDTLVPRFDALAPGLAGAMAVAGD